MDLAATLLAGELVDAIRSGRQMARARSMTALVNSLRRHRQTTMATAVLGRTLRRASDFRRAKIIGASMADHWRKAANDVVPDTKGTATTVAKKVAAKERFRVRMVAATETSRAFNEEREEAFSDISRLVESEASEQPWRQWDASLDRRTCPICEGADGAVVRLDGTFNAGSPGAVHPNCRCLEQVIWMPKNWEGIDSS